MKFAVASIEERLTEWRQIEQAACEAEGKLRQIGQAASDPRVAELARRAEMFRERADREFAAIMRAVRLDGDQP